MKSTLTKWVHSPQILLFLSILLVAAILRFYNISGYMNFLGDEGRDALIVKKALTTFHLPLIGPPMSVGNIYLGPFYYYFMIVAMGIVWLNPVAAAGMVALFGVATVALIYFLTKQIFDPESALLVSFLYAISPVAIVHSRSSWNPNPGPFFAALIFLLLMKIYQSRQMWWFALVGASLGIALQMHYLAFELFPTVGIVWLMLLSQQLKSSKLANFWKGTIGAVVLFTLVMLPLAIFDVNHHFMNFNAFKEILFSKDSSLKFSLVAVLGRFWPIYIDKLISRFMTGGYVSIAVLVGILLAVPGLAMVRFKRLTQGFNCWGIKIIYLWLVLGLSVLCFYKQEVYDHYLGFIAPAAYILFGGLIVIANRLPINQYLRMIAISGFILFLVFLNIRITPLKYPPNNQLARTQQVARFIISKLQNKPFNFALLAAHNYDAAYQYYLAIYHHSPATLPNEKTDQLWVVCEDPVCSPVGNAKYEIAAFGWTKIVEQYTLNGVRIYKLVHNPEQEKQGQK